uniref:Uncharacterized protein n=1 Tax=Globisporangium ultimum (strain ATCC 200006 / CBS 805.95 / DAOM BR144) TaxID=431595 RepID=K3WKJ8_GLOUD
MICAATISEGACPLAQEGLPYGSYCERVYSGVYGCKTLDSESVKTFQPWVDPLVQTPAPTTAAPALTTTTTPVPTTATTTTPTTTSTTTPAPVASSTCPNGSPMSVEGVAGVFCVQGSPVCASDVSNGACPDVQPGLPYGSYCGRVASGVFGCKVLDANSVKTYQPGVTPQPTSTAASLTPVPTAAVPQPTSSGSSFPITRTQTPAPTTTTVSAASSDGTCAEGSPMSVEGVVGIFCVSGSPVCASDVSNGACPDVQPGLPYGSYCGRVASGVFGCKVLDVDSVKTFQSAFPVTPVPTPATTTASSSLGSTLSLTPAPTTATTTVISTNANSDCPNGGSPMSVEGVKKIFCVTGIACAADIANGNCPGPQDDLQFGSYCAIVRMGVYGCRPYVDVTKQPGFNLPAPFDCTGNPAGSTPVSIVGASRDFCANEPICSGSRYGNCPGIQDGLDQDSVCSLISYNVHGCIFKH